MKIVVIGGSGLIGSKLVKKLRADGHDPLPASPDSGVNSLTGKGLAEALEGAQVVVDVANAPDWEDAAVLHFFQTSSRNLVAAEAAAGVGHHVALSVLGADRLPDSGYLRAKVAQEDVVKAATVPYTILRAAQFFEFIGRVADLSAEGNTVRLPPALMQPVAADDVAAALADIATNAPVNGTVELAGPEPLRLDELARRVLRANDDARQVIADVHARYFGTEPDDHSLVPGDNPRIGPTRFEDWLSHSAAKQTNPTNQQPRSDAWKTALTVLDEAKPPFIPVGAHVTTVLVEFPPGDPGTPAHRHPGPAFGYMLEGEMRFELEGEPERVVRAGETFWEPGGDVIHYQNGNNRTDSWSRFVVMMMCLPGQPMLTLVDEEELAERKHLRAPRPS